MPGLSPRAVRACGSLLCAEGRLTKMDVLVVCDIGVERHDVMELPRLLERQDAVIWVDIPACDEVAVEMLSAGVRLPPDRGARLR